MEYQTGGERAGMGVEGGGVLRVGEMGRQNV